MSNTKRICAAVLGLSAAAWAVYRSRKYPIAPGYPPLQWLVLPGGLLNVRTVAAGNQVLTRMPLPPVKPGLQRRALQVAGRDGYKIPITIYESIHADGEMPCLVYFHGGEFCFADAGYIHQDVMDYALGAGCKVVFVHYRTSERAAFPAPFEDCCQALRFVWEHSSSLGVDRGRIAVGGDSAGGALAAACTLWARDETDIRLCFQMLIYPVTDAWMQTASMQTGADTPCWNARLNRAMWKLYLRNGWGACRAYASPMEAASFAGLPDAYVEVEQFDCLRDEGVAYAAALARAGAKVQLKEVAGTFHGFDVFRSADKTKEMLQTRTAALRGAFGRKAR